MEKFRSDVIVVGSGGAGLAAAIEAANYDAKVIVLEKMGVLGGNTKMASAGINGVRSKVQKDLAKDSEAFADDYFTYVKDTVVGGGGSYDESSNKFELDSNTDLELVKTFIGDTGKNIDWLIEEVGCDLKSVGSLGAHTFRRNHLPSDGSIVGAHLIMKMSDYAKKHENIKLFTAAEVLKINKENDKITGVEAKIDGKTYTIEAPTVVIAAGGFAKNPKKLSQYKPELADYPSTNHSGATGEMIERAEAIGANVNGLEKIQIYPIFHVASKTLIAGPRADGALLVNAQGNRFFAENGRRDQVTASITAQEGSSAYLLFPEELVQFRVKSHEKWESTTDWSKQSIVQKGATLEELMSKLNVNYGNAKASVESMTEMVNHLKNGSKFADEKQNAMMRNKNDFDPKVFANPEMFYDPSKAWRAIQIRPAVHHTMGGLVIDNEARVQDKSGKWITGLYAAGEVTGGVHGANRLGGSALADIIAFGRIAGRRAAKDSLCNNGLEFIDVDNLAPNPVAAYKDGIFEVEGKGFKGSTTLKVEVKDNKIISIDALRTDDTGGVEGPFFSAAFKFAVKQINNGCLVDEIQPLPGAGGSFGGVKEALMKLERK